MKFLYPEFLYALTLVLIPVIIHLFHFKRYKKVYFSDISFLKAVQQQAQTKNRLKHLLILLSRILLIIFIVLAFAQPYFSELNRQQQTDLHAILIDNSLSMLAESSEGENFNRALQATQEIIKSYPANHKFMIIPTSGFTPKILTQEDALEKLTTLKTVAKQKPISENLLAFYNFIESTPYTNRYNVFYLSDFQASTFSWANNNTTDISIKWIPLSPLPVANLAVDSLLFNTPYHAIFGNEMFTAIISNKGNEEKENATVQAKINNNLLAPATVNIPSSDTAHIVFNFQNKNFGNYFGVVKIEDYPISFDNEYYFAYKVNDKIIVTEIGNNKPGLFTKTLFLGDSLFQYQFFSQNNINYKSIEQSQFIILNNVSELSDGAIQLLKKFVADGGTLTIFPSITQPENINILLTELKSVKYTETDTGLQYVSVINYNSPLLQGVFIKEDKMLNLPWINTRLNFKKTSPNTYINNILTLKNGTPFLAETDYNKGKVYIFGSNLNEKNTNFGKHSLFVPVMYNMALQSAGQYLPAYSLNQTTIELPFVLEPEKTVLRKDSIDIIPHLNIKGKKSVLFTDEINEPGHYLLTDGKINIPLAFNLKSAESDMKFLSLVELQNLITNTYRKQNIEILEFSDNNNMMKVRLNVNYHTLWKVFILLALLMLTAEVLIIKLWK
jgi:hypothetical protein